jgi:hypothetical protein
MKQFFIFMAVALLFVPDAMARVQERDVEKFCEQNRTNMPEKLGYQFDGHPAHASILGLREGKYDFPKDVEVEVLEDGAYLVEFPRKTSHVYGSTGEDLQEGRFIGGCSLGQLSEVLRNNGILPQVKEEEKATSTTQ